MSRTVGCATLVNTPTNRLRGRARGSVVGAGKGHSDDPHHPLPCAHDSVPHVEIVERRLEVVYFPFCTVR